MNNTMIYDTEGHCALRGEDAWSQAGCITYRGGLYDNQTSTTETDAPEGSYPVDVRPQYPWYPDRTYIADTFTLNDNTTLLDFPLAVAQDSWEEQGYLARQALGLGSNSTTLNVLKNSGRIASRTWSFFYGLFNGPTRMNGHMIFGGYDASRVSGDSSEHSFSTPKVSCPTQLVVTVTGMDVSLPDGTRTSIFGSSASSALAVCLLPTLPVTMKIPLSPYVENFMDETDSNIYRMNRSLGFYYWNLRYPSNITPSVLEKPRHVSLSSMPSQDLRKVEGFANHLLSFDGDIIVTLDTGFSITLPNESLVVPHTYIDQETGDMVVDEDGDEPDLLIDSLQDVNENDMAVFGATFFSAAYLTVNVDAGKFKLWTVNTTENTTPDLRALGEDNEEVTTVCKSDGNPNVDSNSTGTAPTESDTPSGSADDEGSGGLTTGGIAGVAVGVVAAAVIGVVGFVLYRLRKKRAAAAAYTAAEMDDSAGSGRGSKSYYSPGGQDNGEPSPGAFGAQVQAYELHSSNFVRTELPEDSVHKYEMPDNGPTIRHELAS